MGTMSILFFLESFLNFPMVLRLLWMPADHLITYNWKENKKAAFCAAPHYVSSAHQSMIRYSTAVFYCLALRMKGCQIYLVVLWNPDKLRLLLTGTTLYCHFFFLFVLVFNSLPTWGLSLFYIRSFVDWLIHLFSVICLFSFELFFNSMIYTSKKWQLCNLITFEAHVIILVSGTRSSTTKFSSSFTSHLRGVKWKFRCQFVAYCQKPDIVESSFFKF